MLPNALMLNCYIEPYKSQSLKKTSLSYILRDIRFMSFLQLFPILDRLGMLALKKICPLDNTANYRSRWDQQVSSSMEESGHEFEGLPERQQMDWIQFSGLIDKGCFVQITRKQTLNMLKVLICNLYCSIKKGTLLTSGLFLVPSIENLHWPSKAL